MQNNTSIDEAFASVSVDDFLGGSAPNANPRGTSAIQTYRSSDGLILSAISDRNFLRWIVEQLSPLAGKRVFEIGSGTGYFATLLSLLCGPSGEVYGCEIIPELYEASRRIARPDNMRLLSGDFMDILPQLGEFDIILCTSCLSRIPRCVLDAGRKDRGYLAFPIEIPGGGDCFTVFERHEDTLHALAAKLSVSVPSTGRYASKVTWAQPVTNLLPKFVSLPKTTFVLHDQIGISIRDTLAFRSYLFFHEPLFEAVNLSNGLLLREMDMAFGLIESGTQSACLRHGNAVIAIGSEGLRLAALFSSHLEAWQKSGKPTLASYKYRLEVDRQTNIDLKPALKDSCDDRTN